MKNISAKIREKKIYKVTIIGSFVNFLLIIFKFSAGIIGQSSAMIADAVHSLSDFITDIIVLIFVRIANKPIDKSHRYGHGKFETLATLCIGLVLFFVCFGIAWNSINDIIFVLKGSLLPKPGIIALIVALVSIFSKEVLYHYSIFKGQQLQSDAVIANAWHHRSDALSSIATALGIGGAILLGEKWTILDPLAALLVSFFIAKISLKLIKPCMAELTDSSLPEEIETEISNIVNAFNNTTDLHNLRTRKIGNHYAIEFHIRMNGNTPLEEAHQTSKEIELKLKERYGANTHVIVHIEPLKSNNLK